MTGEKRAWIYDLLLIAVLLVGTYLRVIGLNWDENQHLHPDERFLTMVESALEVRKCALPQVLLESCPPDQIRWLGLSDYFNTSVSPLNPENRGFAFFVYGDLPITIVRYVAEWTGQAGYDQVNLVGRQLSALSDLLTILLIYVIAARLYDRRVALLGAAFSTLAVLQIQQSHFFTVDTFANLFIFLAIYFALAIALRREDSDAHSDSETPSAARPVNPWLRVGRDPLFLLSLGFGISLGLAVASKLSAAPLAILLPGAFAVRYALGERRSPGQVNLTRIAICLAGGALAAFLTFRICMPYAFQGLGLSPTWMSNIDQLQAQSSGDADVPFALQWARRSHLYSFTNLPLCGLGLPLSILPAAGFLWMGWRTLKGELRHSLLWGWTALFFTWQSLAFNPTMRYQLPVYPLLCMMAGWLLVWLWDHGGGAAGAPRLGFGRRVCRAVAPVAGVTLGAKTPGRGLALAPILRRPVTPVAATRR